MRKILLLILCLGLFAAFAAAQNDRSKRPRIVQNPTPPTINNDTRTRDNAPPVLKGGNIRNVPPPPPLPFRPSKTMRLSRSKPISLRFRFRCLTATADLFPVCVSKILKFMKTARCKRSNIFNQSKNLSQLF